jgi:YHS domain-containing protein
MKLFACAACMIFALLIAGAATASAEPTTMPTTAPMVVNKLCPVTHEAVDPKIPTVQYKGLTIGFCCEDCIKDFNANPEKYVANLK